MPNIKTFQRVIGISGPRIQVQKLVSASLAGGMDTNTDSVDLEVNQFVSLQNVTNLKDSIVKRFGSLLYSPAKPDSNPVLGFFAFILNSGVVKLLRFTKSSIYLSQAGSWVPITGGAQHGSANDRYAIVVANDRCIITNNGADVIQEFLPNTNTVIPLGNAPKYKYATAFGDRIVGFNLAGPTPNPIQVGWSGNLNYTMWDGLLDVTAGFQPLYDSSSDLSDEGTGIFAMANSLVLIRERSIWEGTLTGSFTQPFSFYTKIPGVGCDSPFTIKRIPNGLIFLDSRTRNVYIYTISSSYTAASLTPIGDPIKDDLLSAVSDPKSLFATYNTQTQEYIICIPNPTSTITKCWKFSLIYKTWSFDTYSNLTSMDVLDYRSGTVTYNDLVGTYNDLIGTYNDLGGAAVETVSKFLGYKTGELAYEVSNSDNDAISVIDEIIESKDFEIASNDIYVSEFRLEFDCILAGSFNVFYSKDSGVTWYNYSSKNSIASLSNLYKIKKQIKTRRLRFKIESTSGIFKFKEYEVWISQGADSRR